VVDVTAAAWSGALGGGVRGLADALAGLFECDRGLAAKLNGAQRRLLDANDRRWCSALIGDEVRGDVQQAFLEYSYAADKRRQVAADVGEATVRLISAMQAAGFSEQQARSADVWALRTGTYRPADEEAR
jgi:hypothetical protein